MARFDTYCDQNSLLSARQSAYRRHHCSTETAALIVCRGLHDIVLAVDRGQQYSFLSARSTSAQLLGENQLQRTTGLHSEPYLVHRIH